MSSDSEVLDSLQSELGLPIDRFVITSRAMKPDEKKWLDGLFHCGTENGRPLIERVKNSVTGLNWAVLDEHGNVRALNLMHVDCPQFPTRLLEFTNLTHLILNDCELQAVPEEIGVLTHLRTVSLNSNLLTEIPTALWNLPALREIHLGNNQVRLLPDSPPASRELRSVTLSGNEIEVLPDWCLEERWRLSVEHHETRYRPNRVIYVSDNPLEDPPLEIIALGRKAIDQYRSATNGATVPINEVKVLLVGGGGAGKTSLVNRLLGRAFNPAEEQTGGIQIDTWIVDSSEGQLTAHLWDFGGQEIMHSTHQFFLSQRSLYVLLLDGRKEEDPEYWLKHIECFGGDAPVVVILNKTDQNPSFDVNRRFLAERHPGITGFYRLSCATGEGVDAARQGICTALEEVEITKTVWPETWSRVKERIAANPAPFLSNAQYTAICKECGVDDDAQETLITFLRDLGTIAHFPELRLSGLHVLEPRWLTGAVYRIINNPAVAECNGMLDLAALSTILSSSGDGLTYPLETRSFIVDVMEKFELAFPVDTSTLLIPDLLPVQEPDFQFETEDALRFRLDYDFLPASILPRFIVRKHQDIVNGLVWRSGALLEDASFGAQALVRASTAARQIEIFVTGQRRRDYLAVLRSAFLDINRRFEAMRCREIVVLPDNPDLGVSYEHLIRLEQSGIADYFPDGAEHAYRVAELLGTVTVPANRTEQQLQELIEKLITERDSPETGAQKAILTMHPNLYGIGVDLNALGERISRVIKDRKAPKPGR